MQEYWKLTCEYTDYNGKGFLDTLDICVNFIENDSEPYTPNKYKSLQEQVSNKNRINKISARKAINQLIKLGFIESELYAYNSLSKKYLTVETNIKRQSIFSIIVHQNSCFNRSVTNKAEENPIRFLIKTLQNIGKISKNELIAIMQSDIKSYPKGYMNQKEIDSILTHTKDNKFKDRKKNQIHFLEDLLSKLDGIIYKDDILKLKTIDVSDIPNNDKRDSYLHGIYKNGLELESKKIFGKVQCMVEKLDFPTLIASHIKPFKDSENEEKYDSENGLLLSKNIDSLFDRRYITFQNNGDIQISNKISPSLKNYLSNYKLDKKIMTNQRKQYLQYHNHLFSNSNE